jgi:hypothetical protein
VSETVSTTVQIALAGPDLVPNLMFSENYKDIPVTTRRRGTHVPAVPFAVNVGNAPSQGRDITLKVELSGGVDNPYRSDSRVFTMSFFCCCCSGPDTFPILPGESRRRFEGFPLLLTETGPQSIFLTISGGGDVNPSNNTMTFPFEVVREDPDPLNRLDNTQKLAEILGR